MKSSFQVYLEKDRGNFRKTETVQAESETQAVYEAEKKNPGFKATNVTRK